jgi:hypothetical protein
MGLFGGQDAGGAQGLGEGDPNDPRRRRAGLNAGGTAGGPATMQDIVAHLGGLRSYDYSGPFRGLADMAKRGGQDFQGPVARHFQNQGGQDQGGPPLNFLQQGTFDQGFTPPGFDNRNPLAGANVAPGNMENGLALNQPPAAPGLQGIGPQTQGWRNVAPGYSAAAQFGYGTPEFAARMSGQGGAGPAGGFGPPGQFGGATSGGGGGQKVGPGGGGPAPTPMTPAGEPTSTLRTTGAPARSDGSSRGGPPDSGGRPAAKGGGGGNRQQDSRKPGVVSGVAYQNPKNRPARIGDAKTPKGGIKGIDYARPGQGKQANPQGGGHPNAKGANSYQGPSADQVLQPGIGTNAATETASTKGTVTAVQGKTKPKPKPKVTYKAPA